MIEKKSYKLGEVCNVVSGKEFKANEFGEGLPVILAKDIKDGQINSRNLSRAREALKDKKVLQSLVEYEDIVIVKDGNSSGKIAINFSKDPILAGSTIFKVTSQNGDFLINRYLYYFLRSHERKIIKNISWDCVIPHLYRKDLLELGVRAPNKSLQQKVVSILDPFAELEKELELRQKQYMYYRDLLLREPLEDPLIKVQEYELGEVCEIISGTSFKSSDFIDSGMPVIKQRNIKDGPISTEKLSYVDSKMFKDEEVIRFEEIAILKQGASSGRLSINLSNTEFLFDAFIWKLKPNPKLLKRKYLYYFLKNSEYEINECIAQGMWEKLDKSKFQKLKIWIPDLDTQEKIITKLDNLSEKGLIGELKAEIGKRKKQFEYYRDYLINDW